MPLHTERASGDGLGDWRDSFIPLHCSECKKNRQSNVALHAHVCTFTLYKIKSYRLDWSLNIAAWIHTCDFLKLFGYKARQSSGIEKVPKHATAPKKTWRRSPVFFIQSGWCIDPLWTSTGCVTCFINDKLQLCKIDIFLFTSRLRAIDYLIQNSDKNATRAWGLSILQVILEWNYDISLLVAIRIWIASTYLLARSRSSWDFAGSLWVEGGMKIVTYVLLSR